MKVALRNYLASDLFNNYYSISRFCCEDKLLKFVSDVFSQKLNFKSRVEPRVLSSYDERSFQKARPKLWNNLPLELKTCPTLGAFNQTHLFNLAYSTND